VSIKIKLALLISAVATIILSLNLSIFYFSSKNDQEENLRREMITIAKQIGTSLDAAEKSKQFMEWTIGEKLRAVAVAAKSELDPRIDRVDNSQLAELSKKLGVDHISLWRKTADDILVGKSSDPKELDMGSKTMDYWYTAFNQLFDKREVTIPQGQKLPNYWSGPYQYASSDPDRINKWGYYYDGTTDYMINPYINAQVFLDYENKIGTSSLIRSLLADNDDILGIAGFDPAFFGKPQIVKFKKGKPVYNLDVRDVPFGEYTYVNKENDVHLVAKASRSREVLTTRIHSEGKDVIKSFIPLSEDMPYIVGVVFDYGAVKKELKDQLILHATISIALILGTWVASYFIAGVLIRPLRYILDIVNEIAEGKFGRKIAVRSRDELGRLSGSVNVMAENLQTYTGRLRDYAEELRSTKAYLESFVDHTSDAIHVTDLNGRVTQANKAFESIYGWRGDEVLGQTLRNVPDDRLREYEEVRRRVAAGDSVADFETVRVRSDGTAIDASITASPIRDEKGDIVAIAEISRNITARKQTEEVIRRTEKLSVIGQMAAGVAHEIRNPLTTLRGFVQLGQKSGALAPGYLDIMLSELDRINLIVGEFLVLAKPQAGHSQSVDLAVLLSDMLSLLESQAGLLNVAFETRFGKDVPHVPCDANQIKQVIINVVKNSLEATGEEGGRIVIELGYEEESASAVIRIADNGRGISEEDLARLGEPFFTKKASGNGLGLMVSQRIVANHKGGMKIASKVGEGTVVEIRLPSVKERIN